MSPEKIHDYLKQDKPLPRLINFIVLWTPITLVWVMYLFNDSAIVLAIIVSLLYLGGYLKSIEEKYPNNLFVKAYFGFWKYLFLALEGLMNLFGGLLAALITIAVIGGVIGILYFGWKQLIQ